MITITTIDSTGEPLSTISVPDQEHVDMNIPEGGSFVEGSAPENSYRLGDEWVSKGARPSDFHAWDRSAKQWIDQRSAREVILEQIAALESTISARRMREAAMGTDGGWLVAVDAEIAALRAGLAVTTAAEVEGLQRPQQ